jgi:molecular chaperone GrpE (heat shock protein)
LKNLADIEAKRQDTWQKTGMFDDSAIADQIAEMEETADAIKQLLSDVAKKYPETRIFIMEGIERVFGRGVSVPTGDVVIPVGEITSV